MIWKTRIADKIKVLRGIVDIIVTHISMGFLGSLDKTIEAKEMLRAN